MEEGFVATAGALAEQVAPVLPGAKLPWLEAARRRELAAFLHDGLPVQKDEPWKYTSLRGLARQAHAGLDAAAGERVVPEERLVLPGVEGPRLVFVHGVFRADLSRLDALPEGLRLLPLAAALAADEPLLREALAREWPTRSDAFARLNTALAADGLLLQVAAGARISAPVHLIHVAAGDGGEFAWHARDLIDLGAGAEVHLVEHHLGLDAAAHLATRVAQVRLAADARLDWVILQEAGEEMQLIRRTQVEFGERANLRLHAVELGGGLVRHEIAARLGGNGAAMETSGVFLPHGRQHMDLRLDIAHEALDTRSNHVWRGVADEHGRGILHGAIVVAPGADGADAALANKNLLLSPHAEIDSQPVLEIYADEVMAVHGATVGQLDEEVLFYLRSRGVPLAAARAMLTTAFCQVALDGVDNVALREHCAARLRERLPAADADEGVPS